MHIQVKDVMNRKLVSIDKDTTIVEAAKIMIQNDISFLPILNKGNLIGILTDRDIINRIIGKERDIYASVFIAMTTNIITINKNEDILSAIKLMKDKQVKRIIVINEKNKLLGILSISDILKSDYSYIYLSDIIDILLLPKTHDLLLIKNTSIEI